MSALPPALALAIDRALAGTGGSELAAAATRLSDRYRAEAGHAAGRAEHLAYLATRLPATYAASRAALASLAERMPDFAPRTLLDLGSGPGTAAWAATDVFQSIEEVTLVERDTDFRALGMALAADGPAPLRGARWVVADLETPPPYPSPARAGEGTSMAAGSLSRPRGGGWGGGDDPFDLVIASFALAEIRTHRLASLVDAAWATTAGQLVLIEPGTKSGTARILAARDRLIAAGAHVAAPCPHDRTCPLAATEDWCHSSVRLPRSKTHRAAKGADLAFEDEKYAYVALGRMAPERTGSRLLFPPRIGKADAQLFLCTEDGTAAWRRVPSRDRASYKAARKLRWGDWVA